MLDEAIRVVLKSRWTGIRHLGEPRQGGSGQRDHGAIEPDVTKVPDYLSRQG